MRDERPEATFAGCPKCGELLHLHHLEWVKAKDAALAAASARAEKAEGALAGFRSAYAILDADYKAAMDLFLDRVTVDFGTSLAALVREEFKRNDETKARAAALEERVRGLESALTATIDALDAAHPPLTSGWRNEWDWRCRNARGIAASALRKEPPHERR